MGIIQSNRTKSPAIYIQGEIKLKIMLLSDLHLTLRHGSLRQHVPGLGLRSAAINRGEDADWSTHKAVGWSVKCNTGLNFCFPLFNINMKMPFLSFINADHSQVTHICTLVYFVHLIILSVKARAENLCKIVLLLSRVTQELCDDSCFRVGIIHTMIGFLSPI